ncbi:MAG TPA: hypothetical protein VJT13_22010 [Xanthobacteraceae bacterium]|nr:hypothetical protein [Xanthobacteraceae bacterium]
MPTAANRRRGIEIFLGDFKALQSAGEPQGFATEAKRSLFRGGCAHLWRSRHTVPEFRHVSAISV